MSFFCAEYLRSNTQTVDSLCARRREVEQRTPEPRCSCVGAYPDVKTTMPASHRSSVCTTARCGGDILAVVASLVSQLTVTLDSSPSTRQSLSVLRSVHSQGASLPCGVCLFFRLRSGDGVSVHGSCGVGGVANRGVCVSLIGESPSGAREHRARLQPVPEEWGALCAL